MPRLLRIGIASLVLALLAGGAWLALHHSAGPRFQGRTPQQWFEQCAQSVQSDGTIQDAAAVRAVVGFGERSVPCLVSGLLKRKGGFADDWNRMRHGQQSHGCLRRSGIRRLKTGAIGFLLCKCWSRSLVWSWLI